MNPNIFKASPVVQTQLTLMSSVDSRLYAGQPYYMKRTVIEIGKKHGSLTLIGEGKLKNGRRSALCLCDLCGKISERDLSTFLTVMPKRCKCKNKTKEQCQHEWYVRKKSKKQISIIEDLPNEIWKDVVGYEDSYEVSSLGRLKSKERIVFAGNPYKAKGKIMKQHLDSRGYYLFVNMWNKGTVKTARVHRLVAIAFVPNPENKKQVNHKKGIKIDNRASELEWNTKSENMKHSFSVLKRKAPIGKKGLFNIGGKIVIQKDLNGNVIKEFPCAREAMRQLGFADTNITACCNGKIKTSRGYKWEFKQL